MREYEYKKPGGKAKNYIDYAINNESQIEDSRFEISKTKKWLKLKTIGKIRTPINNHHFRWNGPTF